MRTKLGSIWVDTATLLIGDPCQILKQTDKDCLTYNDLVNLIFPGKPESEIQRVDELLKKRGKLTKEELEELSVKLKMPDPKKIVEIKNSYGGTGALAIGTGSDGYYPVYLEKDEKGERLIIELGGKNEC